MKLYIAVAVLLLALVAYTDAQEMEQKFDEIRQQFSDLSQTIAEKAKNHFETIQNSNFPTDVKNWFTDNFAKLKEKLQGQ